MGGKRRKVKRATGEVDKSPSKQMASRWHWGPSAGRICGVKVHVALRWVLEPPAAQENGKKI